MKFGRPTRAAGMCASLTTNCGPLRATDTVDAVTQRRYTRPCGKGEEARFSAVFGNMTPLPLGSTSVLRIASFGTEAIPRTALPLAVC